MAVDMVWVRPGILPANMMVAPNSPKALVKASTSPASMPWRALGRSRCQKMRHSDTPRVRAA